MVFVADDEPAGPAPAPMTLPSTRLRVAEAPTISMPEPFPAMRLPAPGAVPPTVLPGAGMKIPLVLVADDEPAGPAPPPMTLPSTRLPVAEARSISMPTSFPAMRLPAPGAVPPTVLPEDWMMIPMVFVADDEPAGPAPPPMTLPS